jgi:hypothetical protein
MLSHGLFRRLIFVKPPDAVDSSMPPWIEEAACHRASWFGCRSSGNAKLHESPAWRNVGIREKCCLGMPEEIGYRWTKDVSQSATRLLPAIAGRAY